MEKAADNNKYVVVVGRAIVSVATTSFNLTKCILRTIGTYPA